MPVSLTGSREAVKAAKAIIKDLCHKGYSALLAEEGDDFKITTKNVDPEISSIAGPQLVVPVMNARFALNAANARWGSLYDALYGTDMIPEDGGASRAGAYNPLRGDKVIAFAKEFLDENFSLTNSSFSDVTSFIIEGSKLVIKLKNGDIDSLKNIHQFKGFYGDADMPSGILLKNNNLHAEIQIDHAHSVGATDPAGIKDVLLESAITTIQDCEDSVAAVDGEDKVTVYRNWLGLMKGDLQETFLKGGKEMTRTLNPDREYTSPDGSSFELSGRSLMLVRNVGHLMTNPAILDRSGNEVPPFVLPSMISTEIVM